MPNTVLPGAAGIVTFSDGSTIDVTNSSSYVGAPLALLGGGGSWGKIAENGGWGAVKGVNGYGGRHVLCLVGQACSSVDLSSYVGFDLGWLTFVVASWYLALGIIFMVLLAVDVVCLFLGFKVMGKRK